MQIHYCLSAEDLQGIHDEYFSRPLPIIQRFLFICTAIILVVAVYSRLYLARVGPFVLSDALRPRPRPASLRKLTGDRRYKASILAATVQIYNPLAFNKHLGKKKTNSAKTIGGISGWNIVLCVKSIWKHALENQLGKEAAKLCCISSLALLLRWPVTNSRRSASSFNK